MKFKRLAIAIIKSSAPCILGGRSDEWAMDPTERQSLVELKPADEEGRCGHTAAVTPVRQDHLLRPRPTGRGPVRFRTVGQRAITDGPQYLGVHEVWSGYSSACSEIAATLGIGVWNTGPGFGRQPVRYLYGCRLLASPRRVVLGIAPGIIRRIRGSRQPSSGVAHAEQAL